MTIDTISPKALRDKLQDKTAVLIDVREAFEFKHQSIPQANHIPLAAIDADIINQFPKDALLVLQCKSGMRSLSACQLLYSLGINNIANLEGGIVAWSQAGFPTLETKSHRFSYFIIAVSIITLIVLVWAWSKV